jgi:hypothetical protein
VSPRFQCFVPVIPEKRPDLQSFKGQTKVEELGTRGAGVPSSTAFVCPFKSSLGRAVSQPFLVQNMRLKIPYKFKTSYGGPPEPQAALGTPSAHGPPSLKNVTKLSSMDAHERMRPYFYLFLCGAR